MRILYFKQVYEYKMRCAQCEGEEVVSRAKSGWDYARRTYLEGRCPEAVSKLPENVADGDFGEAWRVGEFC